MADQIRPRQFHEAEGVEDWCVLGEGAWTFFRTGDFRGGRQARGRDQQAGRPRRSPPDVDVRHDGVTVRLITVLEKATTAAAL
jgi:4a-hydroxytetrahydrobiopterin dehydratase